MSNTITITRNDIASALADKHNITVHQADEIILGFLGAVSGSVLNGDRVELRGFGVFSKKTNTATTKWNIRTQSHDKTKPRHRMAFRLSDVIKREINQ